MRVMVCIKRVPLVGGKVVLSPDGKEVDTKFLGFGISPHEECAVEEAVRLVERNGGSSTVVTLGPQSAVEQLQFAMSLGIDEAILIDSGDEEWGPMSTAAALASAVSEKVAEGAAPDLLLLGNEAPDSGDYQVGIRVATALGWPCVTGVKELDVSDGTAVARREHGSEMEMFSVSLPAVVTVKEGLNLPRYPSLPGRLRAKGKKIDQMKAERMTEGLTTLQLRLPAEDGRETELLGTGVDAVPRLIEVLRETGVLAR